MKLSDLQLKKVISVTTGRNVGSISDIVIGENGIIENLLIQNKNSFLFSKEDNVVVGWNDITKIGEDVILVKKDY